MPADPRIEAPSISLNHLLQHWPKLLLNELALFVNDEPLLIREIELYYHSPEHPDPFPHRYPLQKECGAWYFHRTGNSFRGGSYKGVDLPIGNEGQGIYCGVLLRALESASGELIEGPSLCVDYLLQATKIDSVRELDLLVNEHGAFDPKNPLNLRAFADRAQLPILQTARVGMSLKRAASHPEMPRYWGVPYRFTTATKRQRKGRVQAIIALYKQGYAEPEIRVQTNATTKLIRNCIEQFEMGMQDSDFSPWFGRDLTPKEWCRVMGIWSRQYYNKSESSGTAVPGLS